MTDTNQSNKPTLKRGDRVRTIFGKIETVLSANEIMVVTYESQRRQAWYHPTKVFKQTN